VFHVPVHSKVLLGANFHRERLGLLVALTSNQRRNVAGIELRFVLVLIVIVIVVVVFVFTVVVVFLLVQVPDLWANAATRLLLLRHCLFDLLYPPALALYTQHHIV